MDKTLRLITLLLLASPLWGQTILGPIREPFASSGGGSITFIQCQTAGVLSGISVSVSITPTNGHALIVGVFADSSTAGFAISDNNSNTLPMDNATWSTTYYNMAYFHEYNVSGVTAINTSWTSAMDVIVEVCEVSGLSGHLDGVTASAASGSSATWTATSLTTTHASDIVFGFACTGETGVTFTATTPWNLGTTLNYEGSISCGIAYQVVSAATSYSPTGGISSSVSWGALTAAYY